HYGGEPGSKPVVNVLQQGNITTTGGHVIIEVMNSTDIQTIIDYTVIRLFALPNRITVRNNAGLFDNTVLVKWGAGTNEAAQIARYDASPAYCKIDIEGNIGTQMNSKTTLIP